MYGLSSIKQCINKIYQKAHKNCADLQVVVENVQGIWILLDDNASQSFVIFRA